MGMIVHRCDCGHVDFQHSGGFGACVQPSCSCARASFTEEPEVITSWLPDGTPAPLTPPGTRLRFYPPLCDCSQCQQRYAAETGQHAEAGGVA